VFFEHALLDKPAVAPKQQSSPIQAARMKSDKNFDNRYMMPSLIDYRACI